MTFVLTLFRALPARVWLGIGVVFIILSLYAAYKYQQGRADRAVEDARQSRATTKALDKVSTETPVIRAEQAEKERAVDEIQGSDTRLPDGFGRDLERVRRGERDRNP